MKGDPNKHNRNKYCRFHRDHRHDTDECFDLKQQIENLIRQGKLSNFLGRDYKDEKLKTKVEESSRPPLGEIRMIIGGQRHKHSSSSLLTIEQGENESLRSFITRFNREALTVDEVDDKLLLAAFHSGVNSDLFIHKLYEKEPSPWQNSSIRLKTS